MPGILNIGCLPPREDVKRTCVLLTSIAFADALLGWLTVHAGDALVRGSARKALGDAQQRAFRHVVNSAIGEAVHAVADELPEPRRKELAKQLRKHRAQLTGGPADYLELSQMVRAFLDCPSGVELLAGFDVDGARLSDALSFWITDGVARDALAGGALAPLATHSQFGGLFNLSERTLTTLGSLTDRVEETLEIVRALAERIDRTGQHPPAMAFTALIAERARLFTGRRELLARIDAALADPGFPSGYLLVTGEPGIGKTALVAHLVSSRGYVHHFNSRSEGITSATAFTSMVCAQLADRYDLPEPPQGEETLGSAGLSQMLALAAAQGRGDAPVVILVDALDEAEQPPSGGNRLYLPAALPPHTYVIATSRELADDFLAVSSLRRFHLSDDAPENLADITEYVNDRLDASAHLAGRVAAAGLARDAFVTDMVACSQGNFLYVVHVLTDLCDAGPDRAALIDPAALPVGLRNYYRTHWRVMKDRWPDVLADKYETALRCLAVMHEPVPVGAWVDFAPGDVDERVARHVVREWRQFLNTRQSLSYNEPLYAVYHSTFVDFLRAEGPGLEPYERHVYHVERSMLLGLLRDARS
ncbi:AAA family ATPase [Streptomyces sp. R28]|uniref:AAA family ATPase n=1 Tax=Streptomyces sp. R28 TaxID=3238628 RepID=A0AB39PQQ6_9ACTN